MTFAKTARLTARYVANIVHLTARIVAEIPGCLRELPAGEWLAFIWYLALAVLGFADFHAPDARPPIIIGAEPDPPTPPDMRPV